MIQLPYFFVNQVQGVLWLSLFNSGRACEVLTKNYRQVLKPAFTIFILKPCCEVFNKFIEISAKPLALGSFAETVSLCKHNLLTSYTAGNFSIYQMIEQHPYCYGQH